MAYQVVYLFVDLTPGSLFICGSVLELLSNNLLLCYGIDLKTGNLPVSRSCLYCLSQMIDGLEKVALYR
jgi:hypothetical protein